MNVVNAVPGIRSYRQRVAARREGRVDAGDVSATIHRPVPSTVPTCTLDIIGRSAGIVEDDSRREWFEATRSARSGPT
ncbi:hypothetical protein BRC68_09375 [Halobacteriales archaeon QH_6_64_20]|nr:MAG: hypothetical protein BRC68_09375 [Halobacteriales archaeon QH_6_64_20]